MMKNPLSKFTSRSEEEEIMDDLSSNGKILERTLKELDVINTYLGGNSIVLNSLDKVFSERKGETLRIVDLGCGSGTLLMLAASLAERRGVKVKLYGIDANEFIIDYARKNAVGYPQIEFIQLNVFDEELFSQSFDIVLCSLFCHHIENIKLVVLLRKLHATTNLAIIISDLHRHWLAYYSINILTYLFSSSSMVKNDAGLSVLKAFKREELEALLKNAGIENFELKWKWAFRYELVIDCRK